ncbi:MAG: HAMP domain-containing sensor histidine kinase, partial [Bacteroidota bacterium]
MRTQVEKILHMAALEEGEYIFRRDPVDIHGIIRKAVKAVTLQVSERKGKISTSLDASQSIVQGDAVHIENVIRNVLDNAEKYSPEFPELTVATTSVDSFLSIRISDRGIGMTKEQSARAFDKYYRVPTGNIHDVKGFGIGLSYVKLVVEGHGGTVAVHSESGKGTTVEIRIPVKSA